MIKVDLTAIPAMTADDAYMLTGAPAEDFNQPGIYHVLIGSRSEIDEFEFLGNVEYVEVPTIEELIAAGDFDDEERDAYVEMLKEFYGIGIEDDHINFGYTEEGYDVWVRIA